MLVLTIVPLAAGATTLIHNFQGYTSSGDGMLEFTVLVFDDTGHITASGDDSLLTVYPDAERIDAGGGGQSRRRDG